MGRGKNKKSFVTATEHKMGWGGSQAGKQRARGKAAYIALPFDHCAIGLQPAEFPVCTATGTVFDIVYGKGEHRRKGEGGFFFFLCEMVTLDDWFVDGNLPVPFPISFLSPPPHLFLFCRNIIPWIKKHGTDPTTGQPLSTSDLIRLHWQVGAWVGCGACGALHPACVVCTNCSMWVVCSFFTCAARPKVCLGPPPLLPSSAPLHPALTPRY